MAGGEVAFSDDRAPPSLVREALRLFELADLVEVVPWQRGDLEAALLLGHDAVLRDDRAVDVIGHMERQVAEVPRIAQDVGLEAGDLAYRAVDPGLGQLVGR